MTMTIEGFDKLYSVAEVASGLNVAEGTVRGWIKRGDLVAARLGKGYVVAQRDLQTFIERKFGVTRGPEPRTEATGA